MKSTRSSAKPAAKLELAVQYAARAEPVPTRAQVRRWVKAACPGEARVTVRFVDDEEGRGLNARYRGKDYATNVLSFPYDVGPALDGDLVLCVPVVIDEAQRQGKPAESHFAHLVVHGMLHLQGYDHEDHAQADVMESREREILSRLGYPDPYA